MRAFVYVLGTYIIVEMSLIWRRMLMGSSAASDCLTREAMDCAMKVERGGIGGVGKPGCFLLLMHGR